MCRLIPLRTNLGTTVMVADIKLKYIENLIAAAKNCPVIESLWLFGSCLEERCGGDSDVDVAVVGKLPQEEMFDSPEYDAFLDDVYGFVTPLEFQDFDILPFGSVAEMRERPVPFSRELRKKAVPIYAEGGRI